MARLNLQLHYVIKMFTVPEVCGRSWQENSPVFGYYWQYVKCA